MQFPILSVLIFVPLIAGLLILCYPAQRKDWIRWTALAAGVIDLILSFVVFFGYNVSRGGYQFIERMPWVPALGISYYVGVDGISVPLILLAGIVLFCGVLVSWNVPEQQREFFLPGVLDIHPDDIRWILDVPLHLVQRHAPLQADPAQAGQCLDFGADGNRRRCHWDCRGRLGAQRISRT